MATNSIEKPMGPGQPLMSGSPDIEIEIEDPEKISIIAGDMEIEIDPDAEDSDKFNANLAEDLDDAELQEISDTLLGDFQEDLNNLDENYIQ